MGGTKQPAYTTILSVLQKLERSGWVCHRSEGRSYVYSAARSRSAEGAKSLRSFLDGVFRGDPTALFQHLIDDERVTDEELTELQRMIDQRRRKGSGA